MKYYKTRLWYECTLIVEEFGDVYVVNAKPSDLIQAYENCGIDYAPDSGAKILYCSIFGAEIKRDSFNNFNEFMNMLEKIVADCC